MNETKVKTKEEVLLSVRDLEVTFGEGKNKFVAVNHVNFDIYKGETLSLVGESGSGKTTIGRSIIRINETTNGDILFEGKKIKVLEQRRSPKASDTSLVPAGKGLGRCKVFIRARPWSLPAEGLCFGRSEGLPASG